ncbi:MAG: NAD(P)-dependent oxidoreductase [Oscillospiraceae bacterium]
MYYNYMIRKPVLDRKGIKYLPLEELLSTVSVLTTHLPKHLRLLDKEKLAKYGNGKIIINPSIGPTYNPPDMLNWLSDKSNFLVSESSSMGGILEDFLKCDNFIYTDKVAGMTEMAKQRLIDKVLQNLEAALKG